MIHIILISVFTSSILQVHATLMDRCTIMNYCDYRILRESMECANYIARNSTFNYTIRNEFMLKEVDTSTVFASDSSNKQNQHLYCRVMFTACVECHLNLTLQFSTTGSHQDKVGKLSNTGYNVNIKDSDVEETFNLNSTSSQLRYISKKNWLQLTTFYDKDILHCCHLNMMISSSRNKTSSVDDKTEQTLPLSPKILFNRPITRMEEHSFLNNLMLVACLSGIGLIMLISGLILVRIFSQSNPPDRHNQGPITPSPSSIIQEQINTEEWMTQQPNVREVVDLPPSYDEIRKQESPPPTYVLAAAKLKKLSAQVFKLSTDKLPTTNNKVKKTHKRRKRTRSLKLQHDFTSIPANLSQKAESSELWEDEISNQQQILAKIEVENELNCPCSGACSCIVDQKLAEPSTSRRWMRRTSSLSPTSLANVFERNQSSSFDYSDDSIEKFLNWQKCRMRSNSDDSGSSSKSSNHTD